MITLYERVATFSSRSKDNNPYHPIGQVLNIIIRYQNYRPEYRSISITSIPENSRLSFLPEDYKDISKKIIENVATQLLKWLGKKTEKLWPLFVKFISKIRRRKKRRRQLKDSS